MKSKTWLILIPVFPIIVMFGCAALSKPLMQNDFQLMKAEKDAQLVKLEGENSILKMQVKDLELKLNAQGNAIAGFNNRSENTATSVGGNQTISNDSKLMERVLETYQAGTERFIKALNRVIKTLGAMVTLLILQSYGLLGWIIKFQMNENSRSDKAQEEMLKDQLKREAKK